MDETRLNIPKSALAEPNQQVKHHGVATKKFLSFFAKESRFHNGLRKKTPSKILDVWCKETQTFKSDENIETKVNGGINIDSIDTRKHAFSTLNSEGKVDASIELEWEKEFESQIFPWFQKLIANKNTILDLEIKMQSLNLLLWQNLNLSL